MNRKPIVTLVAACLTASLTSIAFAKSEYEQWLQQTQETFQAYKDKRDKEFTGFLKKQWKEMRIHANIEKDTTPKPTKAPVLKTISKPIIKKKAKPVIVKVPRFDPRPEPKPDAVAIAKPVSKPAVVSKPVVKKPGLVTKPQLKPVPQVKAKPPVVEKPRVVPPVKVVKKQVKPKQVLPPGRIVTISFFGNKLKFSYDPKMKQRVRGRIDKQLISNFWSNMSRTDYELLQKQFDDKRQPLALNDWGYVLLVNKVAKAVYPSNQDAETMFSWFFLIKAGYMARIAYDDSNIHLLLPSKQSIKQSHFKFAGVNYYPLDLSSGKSKRTSRVKTYDGQYPGADSKLNMKVSYSMSTGRESKVKYLNFKYGRKKYRVKVDYDRNTVNFFNTYPSMDYDTYFAADVNKQTGHPILIQLGKIINGKSEEEAVNILMRFTQTAFKYKNDDAHFGTENYLFPEETLHYTYSDCEDRVFMFAWLVRNLTGLKVVGLKYPGHVSAAVHFNEKVSGKHVSFKGQRYMFTEPTYKGGRVGQAPPQHKKARPKVVAITS